METETEKLYRRALDYLKYRPRSEKELRDYLHEKAPRYDFDEDIEIVISSILARLSRLKLLDDEEFVEWWIKQRTESSKPRGFHHIASELYQKGIDRKLTKKIWQKLEIDESELCRQAAQKRARRYSSQRSSSLRADLEDFKERKKLFNYLQRRGFNYDTVKDVIENL